MLRPDRKPDFDNFLRLLECDHNAKPALFELYMHHGLYEKLAGRAWEGGSKLDYDILKVEAFHNAGYDYAMVYASELSFPAKERSQGSSISLNEGAAITDRASFDAYAWQDPDSFDDSPMQDISPFLPQNMKLMVMGPCGVLENVMSLVGYDNLCYMLYEDPELTGDIFEAVGSRLVRYYEKAAQFDSVGMLMSNDDWGFNTQTFLSMEHMRKYVFPWHKQIVEAGHKQGKPVLLHSCGNMDEVMEDIITTLKFDGKHSYEDNILSVEDSYRRWGGRIAILGGIDIDFVARSTPEQIRARCQNMLELSRQKGGYALGTGNSIPDYIPDENYFALLNCIVPE